jgi:large subunit ribosomal protein L4
MTQLKVINQNGDELESIEVSDAVFGVEVREHLFYEVVKWQLAKRRSGNASTKGRSEVSGGGIKPYKQKGTGRARQGSRVAPNHVGGGIVHGPKPRSYAYNISKKLRRAALRAAISKRAAEGRLLVVRDLGLESIKTKSAAQLFGKIAKDPSESKSNRVDSGHALILGPRADADSALNNLKLSVRNLPKVNYLPIEGMNVYDILNHRFLVLREPEVRRLEEVLG